eukprot:5357549-Alexandrium_andersonii.AAC.1
MQARSSPSQKAELAALPPAASAGLPTRITPHCRRTALRRVGAPPMGTRHISPSPAAAARVPPAR